MFTKGGGGGGGSVYRTRFRDRQTFSSVFTKRKKCLSFILTAMPSLLFQFFLLFFLVLIVRNKLVVTVHCVAPAD